MTTYVHLELRRISCRCSTSRKKDARPKIIERFYVHKAASLHKQLYHKHTIFPQYKFDTILKNKSFNPTVFLMPSIFYIPIHFSPTPHSQTMPFLLSVGVQCSHSAYQCTAVSSVYPQCTVHHTLPIYSEQLSGTHQYCASCGVTLTAYVGHNHI